MSNGDRRTSHAFRREVMTPSKAPQDPVNHKVSARRSMAVLATASRFEGENGTPNVQSSRHSVAGGEKREGDNSKMMSLLHQYRQAQEERMRLENSRGRMSVAPPLAEKASVPLDAGDEKYVTVLASEVSDLKARLAEAERRASTAGILPQPSTSCDQRTLSTYREHIPPQPSASSDTAPSAKRESLLPSPIFALAAEVEAEEEGPLSRGCRAVPPLSHARSSSFGLGSTKPKDEERVCDSGGGGVQQSTTTQRSKSLAGLPPSKLPSAVNRRRVTVASYEPEYMDAMPLPGGSYSTSGFSGSGAAAPSAPPASNRRSSGGAGASFGSVREEAEGDDAGRGRGLMAISAVAFVCAAVGVVF